MKIELKLKWQLSATILVRFNEARYLIEQAAFIQIISSNQGSPVSGLLIRKSEAMSVSINKGIHSKIRSESHAIRELRKYFQLCGPV